MAEESKPLLAGLSLSKILSDVGNELQHQAEHGSHEVAAALFNGSGFVMYSGRANAVEDPAHGLPPEAQPEAQVEPQQEMDRGR